MKTCAIFLSIIASLVSLQGCVATTVATASNASGNRSPVISAFTANPTNEAKPGQAITFLVAASDADGDAMQFNWSATGGTLSTNAGQAVSWMPPASPGIFTIQVVITDGKGGAVLGAQNINVAADKITLVPPTFPSPAPTQLPVSGPTSTSPPIGSNPQPEVASTSKPTFALAPMSTGIPVRDFHAFDMKEVWAVGMFTNALAHTTDGGLTWDQVEVGKGSLNGLFFADRQHGWVCGSSGTLFETIDGGRNWTLIDTGTDKDFKSIVMKPDGSGYLFFVTVYSVGQNILGPGGVLVTRDGGKTWKPLVDYSGDHTSSPMLSWLSPSGKVWAAGSSLWQEGTGAFDATGNYGWDGVFWDAGGRPWVRRDEKYYNLDGEDATPYPVLKTANQIYRDVRFYNGATFEQTILFTTSLGVFRSDDGGVTWSEPFGKAPNSGWPLGRMVLFGRDKGWASGLAASSSRWFPDWGGATLYRIGE